MVFLAGFKTKKQIKKRVYLTDTISKILTKQKKKTWNNIDKKQISFDINKPDNS